MVAENVIDKKRGRPLEDFAPARKKVASELMAFEFQSLSLSNPDGSIVHEGTDGQGLVPRPYPPVQCESHDSQQLQQQQQQQQQHHHDQSHHHPHLAQQIQQQRGRAKSSPAGPNFVSQCDNSSRSGKENSHRGTGLPSPPLPLFSQNQHHDHSAIQNSKDLDNETLHSSTSVPSAVSSFSPLSPPISPPPDSSTAVDIAMMVDEGTNISKASVNHPNSRLHGYDLEAGSSSSSSSCMTSTSEVKVLNLRQRKWNSISKEWQEWQEVQCTHTPHLESPQSPTMEMRTSLTHEESGFNRLPDQWPEGYEKEQGNECWTNMGTESPNRQRLQSRRNEKSRLDHNIEPTLNDLRNSYGARARSLSETCIYPYTQQHQHLPPTSAHHMPSSQRIRNHFGHPEAFPSHSQINMQHRQKLTEHPTRSQSDYIHSHGQEIFEECKVNDATFIGHDWSTITMTALDGTTNISAERSWKTTQSSTCYGSSQSSSHRAAAFANGYHQEDINAGWSQSKHQIGHRESIGSSKQRYSYGRCSPIQYGQPSHFYHHSGHGSHDDISMSDDNARLMVSSRPSSPVPCLSMLPTVTRPLSITFSHMAGSNMLSNLPEHEQDDDMEL